MATINRPDAPPNSQGLWLLFGGLVLVALTLCLHLWLFPPDVGLDLPTVGYERDRFVVTARVVNHTIHPLVLRLRVNIYQASTQSRGVATARAFGTQDLNISLAGTAETLVKCEFPRTDSSPNMAAAEMLLLNK